MSDRNNPTSDSSEEDVFLKKDLPMKRICPQCQREYTDPNILFCYYDGNRLITTQAPQQFQQVPNQRPATFSGEFSGFEINLQNTRHNLQIPIELIQSTTRLIQTNPKMPLDSENVKTWYFAIPSPKRHRNFITKFVNHVGFSRSNLISYFFCYILILLTYILWLIEASQKDQTLADSITIYNPSVISLAILTTVYTLVVLILPIISLGYTATDIMQAHRTDFFLKIEPVIIIMALVLNYIIFRYGGPIPILIIPGEPKMKGAPPIEHVVRSLKRSVYPSLLLVLGACGALAGIKYFNYGSLLLEKNVEIMALFGLTILLFELMPFGNFIGKILLKHKPLTFYVSFTLVIMLLMTVISTISF